MKSLFSGLLLSATLSGAVLPAHAVEGDALFARGNLVAWCIVPFDAKKRGPQERAVMLDKLGIRKFVYDYRAEHIPAFDAEMEALKQHNVELVGWWFPQSLNDEARTILDVIQRQKMTKCDLWVMGGGGPTKNAEEQTQRVEAEANRLKPIALEAAKLGVRVGLYNHGAWFGEPENQIEIIERLKKDGITNVGIVYNLHHGHEHLPRFAELMQKMKPYLICLNINGMAKTDADKRKILPIGAGDEDLSWLKIVRDSGYSGPIGILNHTDEDAEARLQDNLDGLAWLTKQLDGTTPAPKPNWRSFAE
ncbi:MAG TPA: TIM barrel protein [Abditibacteriaceae bacterium]|jgi:sugar phosphate isomerase/epimerase